jgi:hypothetical protein
LATSSSPTPVYHTPQNLVRVGMEIGVLIWSWIGLATSSLPRLYTTTQKSRTSRHTKIGLTNVLYFRIRFEELRDSLASWSLARFDLFIRFASSGFMMHDVVLRYDTPGPRFWRRLGTSTRYPPPLFQYFHVRFRITFDPLGCTFIISFQHSVCPTAFDSLPFAVEPPSLL